MSQFGGGETRWFSMSLFRFTRAAPNTRHRPHYGPSPPPLVQDKHGYSWRLTITMTPTGPGSAIAVESVRRAEKKYQVLGMIRGIYIFCYFCIHVNIPFERLKRFL